MFDSTVMDRTVGVTEFEKEYVRPHCIVLDSEYCSMGRMIAIKACEGTGYTYYDAWDLLNLVPECGYGKEKLRDFDMRIAAPGITGEMLKQDGEFIRLSAFFDQAITIALKKGPCLIHERASREMVEAKGYSAMSVITYATSLEAKLIRAGVEPHYAAIKDREKLKEVIAFEDRKRKNYHAAVSSTPWGEKESYDLCINAEYYGLKTAARILKGVMGL